MKGEKSTKLASNFNDCLLNAVFLAVYLRVVQRYILIGIYTLHQMTLPAISHQ